MSTTMVKISTLASAVDNPEDALSPQPLSFRDKHFELFSYWSSKSISPHGAVVILGEGRGASPVVRWTAEQGDISKAAEAFRVGLQEAGC